MTFTLLAHDRPTKRWGGIAATGNLCVGGWVLRGDARAGISASQGLSPSTLWGEDVLEIMRDGTPAPVAAARLVTADEGREERQFMAIGLDGVPRAFTGSQNHPSYGEAVGTGAVAAGNMLASDTVPAAMLAAFETASGTFEERLLAGLRAGQAAGGDARGTQSAALLVVGPDMAPLSLRIDDSADPIAALAALHAKTTNTAYAEWLDYVPTRADPNRQSHQGADIEAQPLPAEPIGR